MRRFAVRANPSLLRAPASVNAPSTFSFRCASSSTTPSGATSGAGRPEEDAQCSPSSQGSQSAGDDRIAAAAAKVVLDLDVVLLRGWDADVQGQEAKFHVVYVARGPLANGCCSL